MLYMHTGKNSAIFDTSEKCYIITIGKEKMLLSKTIAFWFTTSKLLSK